MFGLQLFLLRKRRMLIRYGAVALVGLTAAAIALPRANANDPHTETVAANDEMSVLFSPERIASSRFPVSYNLPHS